MYCWRTPIGLPQTPVPLRLSFVRGSESSVYERLCSQMNLKTFSRASCLETDTQVSTLFKSLRRDRNNNDQAGNDEGRSDSRDDDDRAARSGKFAANHVVLALEVTMKSQNEDQYSFTKSVPHSYCRGNVTYICLRMSHPEAFPQLAAWRLQRRFLLCLDWMTMRMTLRLHLMMR